MADEQAFIDQGLQRTQIDRFFEEELGRAGYGGMEMAPTPMGIQIVLKAEKPGMVIGKGGENIRKITTELEERFDMEDPQIDVQEVDEPDLNARIVADRLANALERGWYFRQAGHTTLERIMDAGALGAEIVLSGKVTGARSRVEKFNEGYIKHNGEPAETIVDKGQSVAVMKLGTIGVNVKIIPPNAELPDDFQVYEDMDPEEVVADTGDESLEELLEEPDGPEDAADAPEGMPTPEGDAAEEPAEEPVDDVAEEPVDDVAEAPEEEVDEFEDVEVPSDEDAEIAEELDELESEVDDASEEATAEAEEMLEEMENADDEAEADDEDEDEEGDDE
jgi:small subunit ribosomal protein S3